MNLNKHEYPKLLLKYPKLIYLAWIFRWALEPRTRFLSKVSNNAKAHRILDLGSGDGMYASKLAKSSTYIGIDKSAENIAFTQLILPHFNWFEGDLENLEFEISEFDEIWCFSVLQYLTEPEKILSTIQSNMKRGAVLKIYSPQQHQIELNLYKDAFNKFSNYETLHSRRTFITESLISQALTECDQIKKAVLYGKFGRISHEIFSIFLIMFSQEKLSLKAISIIYLILSLPFILVLNFLDNSKNTGNGLYTEWQKK